MHEHAQSCLLSNLFSILATTLHNFATFLTHTQGTRLKNKKGPPRGDVPLMKPLNVRIVIGKSELTMFCTMF
jgi:hypothetical protein